MKNMRVRTMTSRLSRAPPPRRLAGSRFNRPWCDVVCNVVRGVGQCWHTMPAHPCAYPKQRGGQRRNVLWDVQWRRSNALVQLLAVSSVPWRQPSEHFIHQHAETPPVHSGTMALAVPPHKSTRREVTIGNQQEQQPTRTAPGFRVPGTLGFHKRRRCHLLGLQCSPLTTQSRLQQSNQPTNKQPGGVRGGWLS